MWSTLTLAACVVVIGLTRAEASAAEKSDLPSKPDFATPWAADVTPANAWREYPRPQMVRNRWQNLNGLWDCAVTSVQDDRPEAYDEKILVPYCIEAPLSGVGRHVTDDEHIW
jgi:beta-galactosidase